MKNALQLAADLQGRFAAIENTDVEVATTRDGQEITATMDGYFSTQEQRLMCDFADENELILEYAKVKSSQVAFFYEH